MSDFGIHHKKSKDPFSVQPVPKPFYFPSPKKYMNGSQAIQAPQHVSKSECHKGGSELNMNNNALTSSSTAALETQPSIGIAHGSQYKDDATAQYDELWPDSERPSSPSFVADNSAQTAVTGFTETRESNLDLKEAVQRLEFYDKFRTQEDSYHTKTTEDLLLEESTLQKYIERFRKSEPKSREERMKEMQMKKKEFWWLQSDAKQNKDNSTSSATSKAEVKLKSGGKKDFTNDSNQGVKLTKEALLAMDEATLHLQTKADRLLCKSEMSVASSGPIVSTDGLGTSYSLSDQSLVVDGPSYRPAFVNIRGNFGEFEESKLMKKEENGVQSALMANPSYGDILARWRFRRKIEESQGDPKPKDNGAKAQNKLSKGSEMDVRLEEFRKRLLSHRMLVTPADIQFERQRMDLLLVKDDEEAVPPKVPPISSGLQLDPVLERIQRITKGQDQSYHPSNNALAPQTSIQPQARSAVKTRHCTGDHSNINNSSVDSQSLSDPMLNKNNTALSNSKGSEDSISHIDDIGMQIIGVAKSRVFHLGQSKQGDSSSESTQPKNNNNQRGTHSSRHSENTNQPAFGNKGRKNMRPLRDLPVNHISNRSSVDQKNQRKEEFYTKTSSSKKEKGIETHNQVYHQFLEAEKPSSEEFIHKKIEDSGEVENAGRREIRDEKHSSDIDDALSDMSVKSQEKNIASAALSKVANRKHQSKLPSKRHRNLEDVHSSDSETALEQSKLTAEIPSLLSKGSKNKTHVLCEKVVCINNTREIESSDEQKEPLRKQSIEEKSQCKSLIKSVKSVPTKANHQSHLTSNGNEETTRSLLSGQHVQSVIGQTVRDHMFDGSVLLSSVDSWASAFPASPVPAHRSLPVEASHRTSSPANKLGNGSPSLQSTPLQSTPLDEILDISDEEIHSTEEFESDPLLRLLRQQRAHYITKLELIEQRLREFDSSDSGS